jgi:hypothetical protein
MDINQIIAIATALQPYAAPIEGAVVAVVKAIEGKNAADDSAADADLRQLVQDALAAKAEADAAAAGTSTPPSA